LIILHWIFNSKNCKPFGGALPRFERTSRWEWWPFSGRKLVHGSIRWISDGGNTKTITFQKSMATRLRSECA